MPGSHTTVYDHIFYWDTCPAYAPSNHGYCIPIYCLFTHEFFSRIAVHRPTIYDPIMCNLIFNLCFYASIHNITSHDLILDPPRHITLKKPIFPDFLDNITIYVLPSFCHASLPVFFLSFMATQDEILNSDD